ncbi:hypothetical protein Emed_003734 [Eimeria media]
MLPLSVPLDSLQYDEKLEFDGAVPTKDEVAIPADWCRSQRRARSKAFIAVGFFAACTIGLWLIFSVCPRVSRNVVKGTQGRRLAEGGGGEDDDLTPPSSPELLDFCLEFEGPWSPEDVSFETMRASPLMVQAFFEELERTDQRQSGGGPADASETSLEESLKPLMSESHTKRPASEEIEEDVEIAGPSSKVAREDTTPPSSESSGLSETTLSSTVFEPDSVQAAGAQASQPSSSDSSSHLLDFLNSFVQTLKPSELPQAPSSSRKAVPHSSSTAGHVYSGPAEEGEFVHPWVRVPPMKPGVRVPEFRPGSMTTIKPFHHHVPLLASLRSLLRRPMLEQGDVDCLRIYAELLVNHAFHKMRRPLIWNREADTCEILARRFLVFYMLHLTSKALGQAWQEEDWWKRLANAVPTDCVFVQRWDPLSPSVERAVSLAVRVSAAVKLYKNGSAPSNEEVISILRELFWSPRTTGNFKKKVWDFMRDDDRRSPPAT